MSFSVQKLAGHVWELLKKFASYSLDNIEIIGILSFQVTGKYVASGVRGMEMSCDILNSHQIGYLLIQEQQCVNAFEATSVYWRS